MVMNIIEFHRGYKIVGDALDLCRLWKKPHMDIVLARESRYLWYAYKYNEIDIETLLADPEIVLQQGFIPSELIQMDYILYCVIEINYVI